MSLNPEKNQRILYCQTFNYIALSMAACLTTSVAFGAQVEPSEYEKLLKEATSTGTVRVVVSIDDTLTLAAISKNPAAVRAAMEQQAKPLLAEAGYWNNGMGQIGIYVTKWPEDFDQ